MIHVDKEMSIKEKGNVKKKKIQIILKTRGIFRKKERRTVRHK